MKSVPTIAIAALALLLTGCSAGDPYSTDASRQLQQATVAVADAASTQDYPAALQQLATLEQANDAALQRGEISQTRHDAIATSITTVRSDLLQLQAAAQQAALQQQLDQLQQLQQPSNNGHGHGEGGGGD